MNLFVAALVADPARTEAVERAVLQAHERTSPFAHLPHDRVVWRRGNVVVASFSVHAEALSIGSYHHATDTTFDTFTGLPRLTRHLRGRSWGRALAEERASGGLDTTELGGVWTLVRASASHLEVRSSLTGSEPVAIARRPGLVLVSNRACLARAAAWPDEPLTVDTDALIPLCSRGWLAHDRLPFTGLSSLPPGSVLEVRPDGSRIARTHHLDSHLDSHLDTRPFTPPDTRSVAPVEAGALDAVDDADLVETYDRIAEELIDAAREVGALGPVPHLELGGDIATRLSAAAYHAAGVEVVGVTTGPHGSADAVLAAQLAAELGIEHRVEPDDVVHRELPARIDRQVRFGEGASNVYDPCPPLREHPRIEVVRHAAGALLGGYDNLATGPRPPVTDVAAGQHFLDALTLHNAMFVLREDARIAQQQVNRRIAEELLEEVGRLSFHELAYLRLREGRANGANRQAASYGAVQVAPLLDDRVLIHLAAIPLAHKRQQRAAFEVMERLAPALTRRPFVGARWRFEDEGPVPWFAPQTWQQRAPRPAGTPAADWRVTAGGRLPTSLSRRLDQPGSGLEEIVDRSRLKAALRPEEPLEPRDVRSLYGVATAQHLFEGRWLDDKRVRRRGREDRDAG